MSGNAWRNQWSRCLTVRPCSGNFLPVGGEVAELLSDQIRNVLTDEIASGVLPPGMGLDEQDLADRFGASRTPVREALRQLAVTGLVEIRPRRGVIVTQTTPERIMEMFEMSAEIEAMCVRIARITPLERGRLIEMHDASEALVKRGDIDGYDNSIANSTKLFTARLTTHLWQNRPWRFATE
jgi:DNA-binding GntR family transcriptional regulator